jgi:hypothetical protein
MGALSGWSIAPVRLIGDGRKAEAYEIIHYDVGGRSFANGRSVFSFGVRPKFHVGQQGRIHDLAPKIWTRNEVTRLLGSRRWMGLLGGEFARMNTSSQSPQGRAWLGGFLYS